jgi:hypothetical protein
LLIASGPTLSSQTLEVRPDGTTSMNLSWQANAYRAFRLRDLYSYFPYQPYHSCSVTQEANVKAETRRPLLEIDSTE